MHQPASSELAVRNVNCATDRRLRSTYHGAIALQGGSADVDGRPAPRVGLGPAQHLVRHRCDVALTEEDEAGQVFQGVALGPAEVHVWPLAGDVPDVQGDRSDTV